MSVCERQHTKDDPRFCLARLKIVIDTLPASIILNPLAVAAVAAVIGISPSEFGVVSLSASMLAVVAHSLASLTAYWVWRRRRVITPAALATVWRELVLLQAGISLCWGLVGWTLWVDGNGANNGLVVILLVMSLWALAMMRCAVRTMFLTGVAVTTVAVALRFALSTGITAHVFFLLMPLVIGYVVFCGMMARRRVDEMLTARFAHEDLSQELAVARDEAVAKRNEAESANASKTAFLANMSHELRTPLNAIIGFSEIIATEALGVANQRYPEYAGDIHSSGTHLLALINEILDVAKIEAGHMEIDPRALDLVSALEAVERIMAIRCQEKSLVARYTVAPDTPYVVADERSLRQILLNLLSNAVKFTPAGGEIDVLCRKGDEGGILLSVTDTGSGIPADKLALLFEPFSQVDNRFDHHHGGTGLGLALVQGLARLHGGNAWIESCEGVGTSVFVYFPLVSIKQELMTSAQ